MADVPSPPAADTALGRSTGTRRALGLDQVPGLGSPRPERPPRSFADDPAPRRTGLVALLVILAVVAAALAIQSVIAFRRAGEVEDLLGHSQAEQLQRVLTPILREHRDPPADGPDAPRPGAGADRPAWHDADLDATLTAALTEHWRDGLRYIAVLGPGGTVRAQAGMSLEPSTIVPLPGPPREPPDRRVGTRWRVYTPLPVHPFEGADPGAGGEPRRPPPGVPPPFVVEVEPSAGAALRREATRSLVVGLTSSFALIALALLLGRWVRHHDRVTARHAHDRRLAALGEMSAVLAHEIRNPLASLKGHAQLLVENLEGDERARDRAKATRVVDEAIRLERLTNDLLEFARTGRIERAPCDPAAVLHAAAEPLDRARIAIDDGSAPARWSLDAGRMAQVLANLMSNALDAAPGKPVTATVGVDGDRLVYRIRDRGPGLPPGGVSRLVEPFRTTRGKGFGLGLAVAQRLVSLHGGTLDGHNHPDGGAELVVTIPEHA
ncbi:MAG TPA: HAMP domain-containing sensor histidine kinase [Kofleriaceae bacterium]|nr:HAMP domain-containing sensor histidine kinase [Kofleriaceae bacterium]